MVKSGIVLVFSLCFFLICNGQDFEKVVLGMVDNDNLYLNDEDSQQLFYLELIPKGIIKGAVIILASSGESADDVLKQINLPQLAFENDIATIVPSINWGTEDRQAEIELLDVIFEEIVKKHNIPKENFVLGGLSNGGMISLVYTQQAVKKEGSTFLIPRGVFGLDVPLDKAHLYEYCEREIERNFSAEGMNEAKWMISNFNNIYGGSPKEFSEKYTESSIYSNGAKDGGNAKYLKNMPIRMYTDLDVNWLINERRRDLYDWNGTDIVAMINDLKLMGNGNANVIITMGKGVRLNGTPHPHSWSIMNNKDCMNWIKKLLLD